MDQLTDLATLTTVAGATAFTPLVVQLAKLATPEGWGARRYRQLSAIVAIVLLVGATILTGGTGLVVVLAALNGVIAGVAASSLYDGVHALGVRTGAAADTE